jgi:hypothetical protein
MLRRMSDELQHSGYYRYERNVTPAMEEFVEAAAYRHYLGHGQLLSLKALQEELERSECKVSKSDRRTNIIECLSSN